VTWPLGSLNPGQNKTLTVTTVCKALAPRALTEASVTADPGISVKTPGAVEIRGLPVVRMKVSDRDDPLEVGRQTEYRIEVSNPGSLPAANVQVVAVVPEELRVLDAKGPAAGKVEGQRVTFPVVAS